MLDFLRRGVKTWVAKVLLGLLIISFAVWGIGDIFTASANSTAARVGDTEVTAEQFARSIQRQQNAISQQRGELITLAQMREAGIDQQAVSALVRDAAFAEELRTLQVAIPDDAVAASIRSNRAFLDGQGAFSQYAYMDVISRQGFSSPEFEQLTGDLLGQQILVDAVTMGVTPLPGAAALITDWQGEQRAVSTLVLVPAEAPDVGVATDSQIKEFYDADPERFREPERRWGSYISVDSAAFIEEFAPTPDEVRESYDANLDDYTINATRTVEQIVFDDKASADEAVRRISGGEASYEEIAAEQNIPLEDLSLGRVRRDEVPGPTADAVFALTEPGIAGPIEAVFGYALLNVTAVQEAQTTPFDEVREAITNTLASQRAAAEMPKRANQIDEVRAGGAEMDEIAAETKLPLVTFAGLASDGTVTEGTSPKPATDPRFVRETFEAEEDEERDIAQLSDGGYALVMIDRIVESHIPELDSIKDKVVEAWTREQQLSALEKRAADLLLSAGSDGITKIGEELEQTPVDLPAYSRTNMPPTFGAEMINQVFAAEPGDVMVGRSAGDRSIMIASLREITPLEAELRDRSIANANNQLVSSVGSDQLEFFARAVEERHGSAVNIETINQVFEQLGSAGHGY